LKAITAEKFLSAALSIIVIFQKAHYADLRKANFRGAVNYSINPLTNKLLKAKFSRPEVMTLLDHLEILID
jgi:hypothetical protein